MASAKTLAVGSARVPSTSMTHSFNGLDIDGPVEAEIFVVWLDHDRLALTGPCGAAAWRLELGHTDHPVEVVDRTVRDVVGRPRLLHSTSWRRAREAVILTFLVVIDPDLAAGMASAPIDRSELARSGATTAPAVIADAQIVEHALRHLAWLANDDPVVSAELPASWRPVLAAYAPEPFRNLG
jgi:hypothetical protein